MAKLDLSMYGTREAAVAWQSEVRQVAENIGFAVSIANPCVFKHHARHIETMVHGDNLISWGDEESMQWFKL